MCIYVQVFIGYEEHRCQNLWNDPNIYDCSAQSPKYTLKKENQGLVALEAGKRLEGAAKASNPKPVIESEDSRVWWESGNWAVKVREAPSVSARTVSFVHLGLRFAPPPVKSRPVSSAPHLTCPAQI